MTHVNVIFVKHSVFDVICLDLIFVSRQPVREDRLLFLYSRNLLLIALFHVESAESVYNFLVYHLSINLCCLDARMPKRISYHL